MIVKDVLCILEEKEKSKKWVFPSEKLFLSCNLSLLGKLGFATTKDSKKLEFGT